MIIIRTKFDVNIYYLKFVYFVVIIYTLDKNDSRNIVVCERAG